MSIQIDFYRDWIEILRCQLVDAGYKIADNEKPEKIELAYFNVQQRQIEPKPREVLIAREFACPNEHKDAVDLLLKKARIGENLVPHQSRFLNLKKKAAAKDAVLFHWGIHHLHLRPEGGLNELLFVRVTQDHFFVIKFGDHDKWFDMDALRIIHRNWPESISKFRTPDSMHCDEFTNEQIENLVGKNANFLLSLDGVCYFPLGGGTVSAGFNIDTIRRMDYLHAWVRRLEKEACELRMKIIAEAKKKGWRSGQPLRIQLEIAGEVPFCVNPDYGIRHRLKSR